MKKVIISILLIFLIAFCVGCKNKKTENDLSSTILIFFSCNDNTEKIANIIAKNLDCGKYRIEPLHPYKDKDLDLSNPKSRINQEMKNPDVAPEIKRLTPLLSVYENVIIGYPIWNGNAPSYLKSYLKVADFPKGMNVYPFAVSDTEKIGDTAKNLFIKEKNPKLKKGISFSNNVSEKEIIDWVNSLKL